jgi:hypothetical protein
MEHVTIFYQAEGLGSVELIEVESALTLHALRDILRDKHSWPAEVELFPEDLDEAFDLKVVVGEIIVAGGTKIHAHRCRKIHVDVSYNGTTLPFNFAPSATIARVKRHVAVQGFHLSEGAAAEHVLQIKGTTTQPAPGTHIGALTANPGCSIAFDLVPKQRVQGAFSPVDG